MRRAWACPPAPSRTRPMRWSGTGLRCYAPAWAASLGWFLRSVDGRRFGTCVSDAWRIASQRVSAISLTIFADLVLPDCSNLSWRSSSRVYRLTMQSRAGSWPVALIHEIYRDDFDNITRENLLSDNSTPMDASLLLISNNISISSLKLYLLVFLVFRYRIIAFADSPI